MSDRPNAPIIIKRKKVVVVGGHHGGAWKVAYADFVTAMMAFFMLMWLLNATTEQQRKGLADYFAPTIAINRVSGGGDGLFGGTDVTASDMLMQNGPRGIALQDLPADLTEAEAAQAAARAAEVDALRDVEQVLLGRGGESLLSDQALRHIVTRLTDEGLVIEVFARPGVPLFDEDTDRVRPLTSDLLEMIARVSALVPNRVAVAAHVRAQPVMRQSDPVWQLTTDRAATARRILERGGLDPVRVARVTGYGDRNPAAEPPVSVRNDRIEIVLLRIVP